MEAMRGPAMSSDVEARIRQRLWAEVRGRPLKRRSRPIRRASCAQVALLAVLLATAAWTSAIA